MSDVFTNQEVLVAHANARLNLHGRRLLVERIITHGRPVAHVAKELGVSRQCAHRWVARFRAEGEAGLLDRSSRPRHCPRRTPAEVEQQVVELRHRERRGQDWLGAELGLPARTVSAILRRHQVPYLRECDPLTGEVIRSSKTTAVRYEHPEPGSLTHMDVKKVGRSIMTRQWFVDDADDAVRTDDCPAELLDAVRKVRHDAQIDFGAVDVMVDDDEVPYVIDINSTPAYFFHVPGLVEFLGA